MLRPLKLASSPLLASRTSVFPRRPFNAKVQQRSQVLANPLQTTDDLVLIIRKIFEEIAICVHPQDSEEAVKVRVAAAFKNPGLSARQRPNGQYPHKDVFSFGSLCFPCFLEGVGSRAHPAGPSFVTVHARSTANTSTVGWEGWGGEEKGGLSTSQTKRFLENSAPECRVRPLHKGMCLVSFFFLV